MERLYYILTGQTLLSSFVSFKGKRKVISLPTLHIQAFSLSRIIPHTIFTWKDLGPNSKYI